jgi:aminoglycoside phosphotransferase (APT) family kinase protein
MKRLTALNNMVRLDNPSEIRQGETLEVMVLSDFLKSQLIGFQEIKNIKQFPGGYSNLTYALETNLGEFVLRRPPFGANIKGGHDMGREFKVLSLLKNAAYAKIPKPVLYCEEEKILGCPFYIMQRVEGVILRAHHAQKLDFSPETMRHLSENLVDSMVELHAIDLKTAGLMDLGKPEGYIRRQVEGWQKRYETATTDDAPPMENIANWLLEHMPEDGTPSLLHNDFKYDNAIFAPDLSQIQAILDWEMCTVGNPLMDLGTALSYWTEAGDAEVLRMFNLTHLEGNLTRQAFANRYAEKSGRDISNILYFYVFGLFKNAGVLQQIYARWKQGKTQDSRFAALIFGVKALAKKADLAIKSGTI